MNRAWTLTISAPCAWLTSNDRRYRIAQGALIRQWRNAACTAAKIAKLPHDLDKIRIDCVARFRGKAPVRDRSNLEPTFKALVDGLGPSRTIHRKDRTIHTIGYGLISDDDDKHLDGPYWVIGDPLPAMRYGAVGEVLVTITEMTP